MLAKSPLSANPCASGGVTFAAETSAVAVT